MASNIDPATMMLMETNLGLLGPNKWSKFPNGIDYPSSYVSPATDAMGVPIIGGSSYVNQLANPGPVTTPGGYDHSASQPSVLDSFLANNQGGTGAGNYSNQGFFDTLNALRKGRGGAGAGAGGSAAQMAQDEVDARQRTPYAAPAAPPQGTTLNTAPAPQATGMGGSEAERQLAGWGALDPVDIGPNALRGLDRSFGSSMATQPLGTRVQNAQQGNIGANLPQGWGGLGGLGGMPAVTMGGSGATDWRKPSFHGDGGG